MGILSYMYHPDVKPHKATKGDQTSAKGSACVPTVRVELVQSAHLPPNQSGVVEACLTDVDQYGSPLLIVSNEPIKNERGIQVVVSLVSTYDEGTVKNLEGKLQIHQSGVCPCSNVLPIGFYWYSGTMKSSGRVPGWVQRLLEDPKQQPNDALSKENQVSADQSDHESNSDHLAVRNCQSSRYPLRARVDPPDKTS